MSVTEELRKAFDDCTIMAGVDPDFECVYITKDAAILYLDEIDAVNDALRELALDMYRRFHGVVIENWSYSSEDFCTYEQRMRELGIEVDE